jgi:nitrous oxidase accessory protein NosD
VIAGPVNFGIGVTGDDVLLKDNRIVCATGSGIGFIVVLGQDGRLDRNSVEGCGTGFAVAAPGYVLTRNLAIGNGVGFNLSDFGELSRSAALGNASTGVTLNAESTPGLLFANTFAGNGGAGANCGLINNTGTAVVASGNFWGSTSGPGADPADQACNGAGGSVTTSPFATTDSTPTMAALR